MYYLDANAFLYPALYDGPKANGARSLLEGVVAGEIGGATAGLTIDEVVHVLSRESDRKTAIEQGRRILELPNVVIFDVETLHIVRALNAMDEHAVLSPRDAIHYAVMREHGIHAVASDDADFDEIPDLDRHPLESFGSG